MAVILHPIKLCAIILGRPRRAPAGGARRRRAGAKIAARAPGAGGAAAPHRVTGRRAVRTPVPADAMTVTFHVHGCLNDLLPAARRGRAIEQRPARRATLKHAIEALGIPHTEIGTVCVNGEDRTLSTLVVDGDRIEVHPPAAPARGMPAPGGPDADGPPFLADAHLGALARRLRLLGYDTRRASDEPDPVIAQLAHDERRVLLTRDRELLMHRLVTRGCLLRSIRPDEQLLEVIRRLGLRPPYRPFTRCLECNEPLREAAREDVLPRLPPAVAASQYEFTTCPGCGRVFWKGSHWRRLGAMIEGLR